VQFVEAANTIRDFADEHSDIVDAYVTLCVHAGIAASDVFCCLALGVYPHGESHSEAIALVAKTDKDAAKHLRTFVVLAPIFVGVSGSASSDWGTGRDRRSETFAVATKEIASIAASRTEICAAAGVPKGSFYYFFESKQALALTVIDEHWAAQQRQWVELLDNDRPPLRRLRDLFDATETVQRAGQRAARSIVAQLEGRVLFAKLLNDPAQLETLWRNCLALLGAPADVLTSN
jgi:hypothetical protein